MAHSEQTITSITEIPALIATFATARGWTAIGVTLTRPGGGRSFEITVDTGKGWVYVTDVAEPTHQTITNVPKRDGAWNNPVLASPTKLFLYGNDDPWEGAPWIAAVIEFGYNDYRHIYIGNAVKHGAYTGGEIISANFFYASGVGNTNGYILSYDNSNNSYLLSALKGSTSNSSYGPTGNQYGGMYIEHSDNPTSFRNFWRSTTSTATSMFRGDEVLGGHLDCINSGLVRRGLSDFSGSNILVPINLLAPDAIDPGNNPRFRPVGYVPGVRMLNMSNVEAAETILVGNDNWRIFPEFSKQMDQYNRFGSYRPDGGAGGFWPMYESSYLLGLAYKE